MSQQVNPSNFDKEVSFGNEVSISEVLRKYTYHWPVFVLGLIICFTSAFLYLRYTTPIYEVSSTLLIKDDKKSASSDDMLSQLDLFGSSKVVENEIEILRSKTLMAAVVKRLNLNVSVKSIGRLIGVEIYEQRPVNFQTFQMTSEYFGKEWKLTFPNQNQYVLEDEETGKKVTGPLNQLQRNFIGTYKVDKTKYFSKLQKDKFSLVFHDPIVVVGNYLGNLSVVVSSKQSTVLKLSFQTAVSKQGQDVLNTLIQVYNEAGLADKNRTTQSTLDFIDERLKLVTGELVEVEKDVEGFKSSQGLTDISSEATLYLENVKANDAKINEVDLKLNVIKDIQRYVNSDSP